MIQTAPDLESAVIDHLLGIAGLTTLVADRIYAELPPNVVYPALTVRTISSRSGSPRWLEAGTLEVAGWSNRSIARARRQARDVCEIAVTALNNLVNATLDGCVVVGPVATAGPRSVPDVVSQGVTNPRFIAEVSVTFHPVPTA